MRNVIVIHVLLFMSVLLACFGDTATPTTNTAVGKSLVTSLACQSCHGVDLSGSESPIEGTLAYAANLTSDDDTGLGAWADDEIAAAIRSGTADDDSTLCTAMPRFGTLSDDQLSALVSYLRSLAPITHAIPDSDCDPVADLDDAGLDDAGVLIVTDEAGAPPCDGYADPMTPSVCHACSGASCQKNGCFGGYFCEIADAHCVPAPDGC